MKNFVRKSFVATLVAIPLITALSAASAQEKISGYVTYVEPSYLPHFFIFKMDADSDGKSCKAGTGLRWVPDSQNVSNYVDNNKYVSNALIAAMLSKTRVNVFISRGFDNSGTCGISWIHLLEDSR